MQPGAAPRSTPEPCPDIPDTEPFRLKIWSPLAGAGLELDIETVVPFSVPVITTAPAFEPAALISSAAVPVTRNL
jgi:hypothetical protein